MNDFIQTIKNRRSIRKFKSEQISDEELNIILEAGQYAPCSGSRQSPLFVVCQKDELNKEIGKLNGEEMKKIMDKRPPLKPGSKEQPKTGSVPVQDFSYGAPTLVTIFAPKNWHNFTLDAAVAAQNMCLAATSLNIGSCIIARASETFASIRGQEIQRSWGISEDYEAKLIVLLGYVDGDMPKAAPRHEGRVKIIK